MKNKEQIRKSLLALADAGKLTPEEVIRLARSPESILHPLFEWDDSVAARKYRVDQARTLISSFEISVTINRVELRVQEFVRDPSRGDKEQGYRPISSIKSESEEAIEFVIKELSVAKTYVDRTERFAQMLGLQKDTRALSNRLSEIADSLSQKRGRKNRSGG